MATKEVPLWSSEAEIEHLLTKKRKAEEEMPYNTTEARKRARSIGIEEAAHAMEEPVKKTIPFGLTVSDDSSSEFATASEEGLSQPRQQHVQTTENVSPAEDQDAKQLRQARKARRRARKKERRANARTEGEDLTPAQETEEVDVNEARAVRRVKRKAKRRAQKAAKEETANARGQAEAETARARAEELPPSDRMEPRIARRKRRNQRRMARRKARKLEASKALEESS